MLKYISIIIPFYNGEAYYKKLLRSLRKAILKAVNQNVNFEIITIIDSVLTDEDDIRSLSADCFAGVIGISLVVHKNMVNLGVAGSRNVAFSLAHGTHFHIIDQDDEVNEQLYCSVIHLLDKKDFILINGLVNYTSIKYNSHLLYYIPPKVNVKHLLKNEFIRSPGQVIFSLEILGLTRFPEPKKHKGTDDRFFWIKLFLDNPGIRTHYVSAPLYIANIHDDNYSSDSLNLRRSSLENWDILAKERDLSKYEKIVEKNILSLKYAAGEQMIIKYRLKGLFNRVINFLELNKMIRFFLKRMKW